jgi:cellulose biosynthesis protein BcsQ
MENMNKIQVSARKGGLGTTTVACAIALTYSRNHPTLKVGLVDGSRFNDCLSVMGLNPQSPSIDGVTVIGKETDGYDVLVIDAGVTDRLDPDAIIVNVVRNEYLPLRAETFARLKSDYTVALIHEDNALTAKDVANVLGAKIMNFPISSQMSRAIDAGLFTSRFEQLGNEWATELVESLAFRNGHELLSVKGGE